MPRSWLRYLPSIFIRLYISSIIKVLVSTCPIYTGCIVNNICLIEVSSILLSWYRIMLWRIPFVSIHELIIDLSQLLFQDINLIILFINYFLVRVNYIIGWLISLCILILSSTRLVFNNSRISLCWFLWGICGIHLVVNLLLLLSKLCSFTGFLLFFAYSLLFVIRSHLLKILCYCRYDLLWEPCL